MIQGDQIRAARALLGWHQDKLGKAARISAVTIKRLEAGANTSSATVAAVQDAMERAGVLFLEPGDMRSGGRGVRLKR